MYTLTMNRVRDRMRIVEGADRLDLRVDGDPMRMVAGLNEAQRRLREINDESAPEQQREAALFFASAIFGDEQAKTLMDFYRGDAACVISVCGRYFSARLAKRIEKAQKRAK